MAIASKKETNRLLSLIKEGRLMTLGQQLYLAV